MRRIGWMIGTVVSLHAQWDDSLLQKSAEMYDEARAKTIAIYQETLQTLQTDESIPFPNDWNDTDALWQNNIDKLSRGASLLNEMDHVPTSSWIKRDKTDVQNDFERTLDMLMTSLSETPFRRFKQNFADLQRRYRENQKTIATYRERRLHAPKTGAFRTTQEEYEHRIKRLEAANHDIQHQIATYKTILQQRFDAIGVRLNDAQIDVLLTRIDGEDIIKMAIAVDAVNAITRRLATSMRQKNQTVDQIRRYYGIYEVLQELVVHMHQAYIDKCDKVYLPKIDRIITDAKAMIDRTVRLQAREDAPSRRKVYAANVKALKETLSVATRYRDDLLRSKARIQEAKREAIKNLQLAKNTYKTVMLSSDLYALIQESREAFLRIEKIQVPPIVPFENQAVKQAYEQVTRKLK